MPLIPKKSTIVDKEVLKKEFIILGWKILYHKCLYYELSGETRYDFLRFSDAAYDALEERYIHVARIIKETPTASNQVGFNIYKGSGYLTLSKILFDEYVYRKHIHACTKPKKI